MATLTEWLRYKKLMKADPVARSEYLTSGLSKQEFRDSMQAIENWFEKERPKIEEAINTAASKVVTNTFSNELIRAWMKVKLEDI